ncbi:MAG: preprotein translocase subunit SecY [Deltaproteobacteria bacterium RIFCSPLOWO2_01_44_7]|nr:MAG: preprotein translocase subunit SecY [Deltaproteobacteria bacterium RIFCSPHIGHO2_01_FULL_43_49]OGQ14955.1 MAG: preprotein translocase subunit SecY [Deltaproteobacteria bacterium RIFCSPHIGHO2_02_FULL_44_53]OGQ29542.1 MAG: preprotein translocase subunit SecY [Deltaproteobacteria bacterium RIFCSPHIGHO2_12_FULL_44_21]OGQ31067.1 MAG: preprotein translocase subunit SecY [Deltaproteobacteria bacterium RIFCSPLOWO2_01_FULL_45_74]OGQ41191.1 MAG: preprotein translocase subunit SecY [Deltaproteobact
MTDVGNIAKIPELRKRLLFTLMMVAVYRLGIFIHTPWVNTEAVQNFLKQDTVFEIFKLFSGGALEQFSVFALGIMPYISASIIFQLLTVAVPSIERLSKEGDAGRRKITQYTRYATVALSLIQGFGISYGLRQQGFVTPGIPALTFYCATVFTLAAGTSFLMWVGEMITERGIGNGISLIIFAGIIDRIPSGFRDAWQNKSQFGELFGFIALLAGIALVISVIIFMERSQRRIPIQYAKRVVGRQLMGIQASHLPLKINSAGVIPPIFASSLILFPATIAQFSSGNEIVGQIAGFLTQGWIHNALYVALIIFFTYFYTAVAFNPVDVSENLKKMGGYVPGIRPGKSTSDYIDQILTRITLGGALYIAAVCVVPSLLGDQFGIPYSLVNTFGGTSLLIAVGVAMDTLAQIESHLLSRHYEGFLGAKGGGRFRGRR